MSHSELVEESGVMGVLKLGHCQNNRRIVGSAELRAGKSDMINRAAVIVRLAREK
jgi:hypothetical protein